MSKNEPFPNYRWRLGDRTDGYRIRKIDAMFRMVPYFLRTRMDSQIFFEERFSIASLEAFIKQHKETIPNLSIMHVFISAFVRVISQRPYLNRFVIWNKIFARKEISFSIAIKRNLSDDGEETMIKPIFSSQDTLLDVVQKISLELDESKPIGKDNRVDAISKLLGVLPDFLMRFVVFCLIWGDKVGILPTKLLKISPWHASAFFTNMGSIGVESVYHHLYEFGTCSLFLAMGKKSKNMMLNQDKEVQPVKSVGLRFVVDERICDGFYYASSMRLFAKMIHDPAQLLLPPEKIVLDEGVGKRKWRKSNND